MKFDPIIPVAVPVVRQQFRFMRVGKPGGLLHRFAAGVGAERGKLVFCPGAIFATRPLNARSPSNALKPSVGRA